MNRSVWRPIAIGVLVGTAAYFMPFFMLKGFLFFFLIAGLFRFFFFRRMGWGGHGNYMHVVYADHLRNMSEDDYAKYKERFQGRGGCGGREYHPYENVPKDKNNQANN